MRKRVYSFVVFILLSILNSSVLAQSSQISNGLSWLNSAQTASGNWPQVVTTDYYSTAASLDAIYAVDPANPAYGTTFQWLKGKIISGFQKDSDEIS